MNELKKTCYFKVVRKLGYKEYLLNCKVESAKLFGRFDGIGHQGFLVGKELEQEVSMGVVVQDVSAQK